MLCTIPAGWACWLQHGYLSVLLPCVLPNAPAIVRGRPQPEEITGRQKP